MILLIAILLGLKVTAGTDARSTLNTNTSKTEVIMTRKVKEAHKLIENGVVAGYRLIESGVVTGYKKVEDGVVSGYKKVEDKLVDNLFRKEDETLEEARNRLNNSPKTEKSKG